MSKGFDFAQVRDLIADVFEPDEFDMFLYDQFDFSREKRVEDGPFLKVVNGVLTVARQEGWYPILIAEVAAARPLRNDVQEMYKKFALHLVDEARQQQVEGRLAEALERYGLAPKVSLQESGKPLFSAAASSTSNGFQKRVVDRIPQLNAGLWMSGLFQQQRRVGRVEIGNDPVGTGFLVGPDTVITNYHVLKSVIDYHLGKTKDNQFAPGRVRVRFDFQVLANGSKSDGVLAGVDVEKWLVDFSPYAAGEAQGSPDETTTSLDELDYAIVRLDRPIGNELLDPDNNDGPVRGWVWVPKSAPALPQKMPLMILQHPLAAPLKLAFDTSALSLVYNNGARVRYAVNTEPGSSGSPVFDIDWNLVALHHYGDPTYTQSPKYNQGIPIIAIRERLSRPDVNKADCLAAKPAQ